MEAKEPKGQCRACMKRVSFSDLISVRRRGGGNYRRPPRRYHSTICRECATDALDYADKALAEGARIGDTTSNQFYYRDMRDALNRPVPK